MKIEIDDDTISHVLRAITARMAELVDKDFGSQPGAEELDTLRRAVRTFGVDMNLKQADRGGHRVMREALSASQTA